MPKYYRAPSKFAGPPVRRKQLATRAARKSVPHLAYSIPSDHESDKFSDLGANNHGSADLAADSSASRFMHRPNGAVYRIPRSRVAGPRAPRKQLASLAARKSAPPVRSPCSSDSQGIDNEDEDSATGSLGGYFCRKNAGNGVPTRSKRGREAEADEGTSKQSKRPRTQDNLPEMSDRHQATDLVELASLDVMKRIFSTALGDEVMRPRLEQLLESVSDEIVEVGRCRAEEDCAEILDDAEAAIQQVVMRAFALKGMESSSAWGDALSEYLPRLKSLLSTGPVVNGPQEAWMGLMGIARLALHDWESGEPRVQEGEDANDSFHEEVDDGLLAVCKLMEEHGRVDWLRDGKVEEVWTLQERPSQSCLYRYQRTLAFLEQCT